MENNQLVWVYWGLVLVLDVALPIGLMLWPSQPKRSSQADASTSLGDVIGWILLTLTMGALYAGLGFYFVHDSLGRLHDHKPDAMLSVVFAYICAGLLFITACLPAVMVRHKIQEYRRSRRR